MHHVIKKQRIKLRMLLPKSEAIIFQEKVGGLYHKKVKPVMEACFNEYGDGNFIYTIGRLNIDIGTISPENLNEEFAKRVGKELTAQLKKQIPFSQHVNSLKNNATHSRVTAYDKNYNGSGNFADADVIQTPKEHSVFDLFCFFIRRGTLPWWARYQGKKKLERDLKAFMKMSPEAMKTFIQRVIYDEIYCRRFIHQFSDAFLGKTATLFLPDLFEFINSYQHNINIMVKNIKNIENIKLHSFHSLRLAVWRSMFHACMTANFNPDVDVESNRSKLIRRSLLYLSQETRLPYPMLISRLKTAMDEKKTAYWIDMSQITLSADIGSGPAAPVSAKYLQFVELLADNIEKLIREIHRLQHTQIPKASVDESSCGKTNDPVSVSKLAHLGSEIIGIFSSRSPYPFDKESYQRVKMLMRRFIKRAKRLSSSAPSDFAARLNACINEMENFLTRWEQKTADSEKSAEPERSQNGTQTAPIDMQVNQDLLDMLDKVMRGLSHIPTMPHASKHSFGPVYDNGTSQRADFASTSELTHLGHEIIEIFSSRPPSPSDKETHQRVEMLMRRFIKRAKSLSSSAPSDFAARLNTCINEMENFSTQWKQRIADSEKSAEPEGAQKGTQTGSIDMLANHDLLDMLDKVMRGLSHIPTMPHASKHSFGPVYDNETVQRADFASTSELTHLGHEIIEIFSSRPPSPSDKETHQRVEMLMRRFIKRAKSLSSIAPSDFAARLNTCINEMENFSTQWKQRIADSEKSAEPEGAQKGTQTGSIDMLANHDLLDMLDKVMQGLSHTPAMPHAGKHSLGLVYDNETSQQADSVSTSELTHLGHEIIEIIQSLKSPSSDKETYQRVKILMQRFIKRAKSLSSSGPSDFAAGLSTCINEMENFSTQWEQRIADSEKSAEPEGAQKGTQTGSIDTQANHELLDMLDKVMRRLSNTQAKPHTGKHSFGPVYDNKTAQRADFASTSELTHLGNEIIEILSSLKKKTSDKEKHQRVEILIQRFVKRAKRLSVVRFGNAANRMENIIQKIFDSYKELNTAIKKERTNKDFKTFNIQTAEKHMSERQGMLSDSEEVYINNSGLILLWPFIGRFFQNINLVEQDQFIDEAARVRGVFLLQYLADGSTDISEHLLPLNKALCGMDIAEPVEPGFKPCETEIAETKNLLTAVIKNWKVLKDMSHGRFRELFILREGLLSVRDGLWLIRPEKQPFDVLLNKIPWSVNVIKLPWLKDIIYSEWG